MTSRDSTASQKVALALVVRIVNRAHTYEGEGAVRKGGRIPKSYAPTVGKLSPCDYFGERETDTNNPFKKEAVMKTVLLVALGSAVAVSGRAQAPAVDAAQPSSAVRVAMQAGSRQSDGTMTMSGVAFYFSDGTQLSAKTAISPGVSPREFILSGDVRLRLTDKSTLLK